MIRVLFWTSVAVLIWASWVLQNDLDHQSEAEQMPDRFRRAQE